MRLVLVVVMAVLANGCGFFVNVKNLEGMENGPWQIDPDFAKNQKISAAPMRPEEIYESYGSIQIVAFGDAYSNGTVGLKSSDQAIFGSAVLLPPYAGRTYLITAGHIDGNLFRIKKVYAYFSHTTQAPPEVELIIVDKVLDWALLRIKNPSFIPPKPAPPIGSSEFLKPGMIVVAIGSPFEYQNFVRSGCANNLDLGRNYDYKQPRLIAHQCPINPGDSGSALYDGCGNLVGINVMGKPGPNWISLAVPIEDVIRKLRTITTTGYVQHAYLGCKMWQSWDLSDHDLSMVELKRPERRGIVITRIEKDSPAEKAGLKPGDVVLEYNGQIPKNYRDISRYIICECSPGGTVTFKVDRYGQIVEATAVLTANPIKD